MNGNNSDWFDDYAEGADELQIDEYDITASPNDFNVITLHNFVESGAVRIPGFQRNFVWDIWTCLQVNRISNFRSSRSTAVSI